MTRVGAQGTGIGLAVMKQYRISASRLLGLTMCSPIRRTMMHLSEAWNGCAACLSLPSHAIDVDLTSHVEARRLRIIEQLSLQFNYGVRQTAIRMAGSAVMVVEPIGVRTAYAAAVLPPKL